MVAIIGIVKKNAIMMIDFALQAQRKEGKIPHDAIFEACRLRFRPIPMTTMAALLGALPLALGTGTGYELRRPLDIAIVEGLILSQMPTLYTTPIIYLEFDRSRLRMQGRQRHSVERGISPAPSEADQRDHASCEMPHARQIATKTSDQKCARGEPCGAKRAC